MEVYDDGSTQMKAMSIYGVNFLNQLLVGKRMQNQDRELQNVELFLSFSYENNDSSQPSHSDVVKIEQMPHAT